MSKKIIHYCWFGGNPLPKLAKKCIASWQKYLPDYEIKEWNESNFDVNICPFTKGAYENKKWAFIADYARVWALEQYGGIYFDTDMEVLKPIDEYLKLDMFLGYQDNGQINAAVIGAKRPHEKHIKELLDYYNKQKKFDPAKVWDYAIPNIVTKQLSKYKKTTDEGVEIYDGSIYVYPRDYFYPLNYHYTEKCYTDKTVMVHWFDATWVPKYEKIKVNTIRKFGPKAWAVVEWSWGCLNTLRGRVGKLIKATVNKKVI